MEKFQHIDAKGAKKLIEDGAVVVDIRDPKSFQTNRIAGAQALTNNNIQDFISEQDLTNPVIVCCYHGISSQSAASFLIDRGFDQVFSLDGGFEQWSLSYPEACEQG